MSENINEKNNDKIKVGIKYCGGCNPRYNRGAYVRKVCGENPNWECENAKEGERYGILLVAGGCSACCASYEQYDAERIARFWEEDMPWQWVK